MEQGKPETHWGVAKNKGKVWHATQIKEEPITNSQFGERYEEQNKKKVT